MIDKTREEWVIYYKQIFSHTRTELVVKTYAIGDIAAIFVNVAVDCGAIATKFNPDGSIEAIFSNIPNVSSTSI